MLEGSRKEMGEVGNVTRRFSGQLKHEEVLDNPEGTNQEGIM